MQVGTLVRVGHDGTLVAEGQDGTLITVGQDGTVNDTLVAEMPDGTLVTVGQDGTVNDTLVAEGQDGAHTGTLTGSGESVLGSMVYIQAFGTRSYNTLVQSVFCVFGLSLGPVKFANLDCTVCCVAGHLRFVACFGLTNSMFTISAGLTCKNTTALLQYATIQ